MSNRHSHQQEIFEKPINLWRTKSVGYTPTRLPPLPPPHAITTTATTTLPQLEQQVCIYKSVYCSYLDLCMDVIKLKLVGSTPETNGGQRLIAGNLGVFPQHVPGVTLYWRNTESEFKSLLQVWHVLIYTSRVNTSQILTPSLLPYLTWNIGL